MSEFLHFAKYSLEELNENIAHCKKYMAIGSIPSRIKAHRDYIFFNNVKNYKEATCNK